MCDLETNLSLFVGELWAVSLQVLHDALHAAGAEQPDVRENQFNEVWFVSVATPRDRALL